MKNTRHITMGAMTLGLSAIIQLLAHSTLGFFMSFLTVPLVVYGYFYSFRSSVVVYIASIGLSFALTGYLPTIITVAGYGLVGLALIYGMRQKWGSLKRFLVATIAVIPVYVVMIGFFSEYFGYSIPETVLAITRVIPSVPSCLIITIVYLGALLLGLMEVYIIKVVSEMLILMLIRRFSGMTK